MYVVEQGRLLVQYLQIKTDRGAGGWAWQLHISTLAMITILKKNLLLSSTLNGVYLNKYILFKLFSMVTLNSHIVTMSSEIQTFKTLYLIGTYDTF